MIDSTMIEAHGTKPSKVRKGTWQEVAIRATSDAGGVVSIVQGYGCGKYQRTYLTPEQARQLAAQLIASADTVQERKDRNR